jgi:PKD repeat protein
MFGVPASFKAGRDLTLPGAVAVAKGDTLTKTQLESIAHLDAYLSRRWIIPVPDAHGRDFNEVTPTPTSLPPVVYKAAVQNDPVWNITVARLAGSPLTAVVSIVGGDAPFALDYDDGHTTTVEGRTSQHAYDVALDGVAQTISITDESGRTDTVAFTPLALQAAGFTAVPDNLLVAFTNTTTETVGHACTWLWDFGDDTTSTDENPSHGYIAGEGTYTVTLTATSDLGVDVFTDEVTVAVDEPVAAFTATPALLVAACDGTATTNMNNIKFGALTIEWTSDDPGAVWVDADALEASVTFSGAGTYSVTLTVTNGGGTDSVSHDVTVVAA